MKRYVYALVVVIGALIAAAPAARAGEGVHDMVITVPFEFTVGTTTLPRDTYRWSRASGHSDVFLLSSLRRSVFVVGQRNVATDRRDTSAMVFHRYGNQHFLRDVQFLGHTDIQLPASRAERDAAERRADNSSRGTDVVVIAAKAQ